MTAEIWGLSNPWDPEDPDRPCFTCGHPPTHRFSDGSPKYLAHHWDHRNKPVYLPEGWEPVQGIRLVHRLDEPDQAAAIRCGEAIYRKRLGAKSRDRFGSKAPPSAEAHILGVAGEIAFARLTGLSWTCRVGKPDAGRPDIARYEIRTRSQEWHELPIHAGDRSPTVLMVKLAPWTFRLKGWRPKPQADLLPQWYWDRGYRTDGQWLVPQSALEDPRTIPELAP